MRGRSADIGCMRKLSAPPPNTGGPVVIVVLAALLWTTEPIWNVPLTVTPPPPKAEEPKKPGLFVRLLRVGAEIAIPATTIFRAFDD